MAIWEKFAKYFGPRYSLFVACLVHEVYFNICLNAAWPSPVLAKLNRLDPEDNPLGRRVTDEESDLIGSLFFVGAAIGPLVIIVLVEKFGRKNVLDGLSLMIPIAYVVLTFTNDIDMYFICRTVLGFYSGAALSIQPVYLTEILPKEEKDFLMSLETVFNFMGILYAYAIAPAIPLFYFNLSVVIFAIFIFVLQAVACPSSPFDVMKSRGVEETRAVLQTLRNKEDVNAELEEIRNIVITDSKKSYFDIFKSKDSWKALMVGTVPLIIQQWCGIPLLITYSQLIFNKTNISISSDMCSIIVVVFQVSTTFLTPVLLKCKTFTRKGLVILCLTLLGLCNLVLALYFLYGLTIPALNWLPMVALIAFVISYNCGIDSIPWIIMGEIYPTKISAVGSAISTSLFFGSIFPLLYSFRKVNIGYLFLTSFTDCVVGVLFFAFVYVNLKKSYRKGRNLNC